MAEFSSHKSRIELADVLARPPADSEFALRCWTIRVHEEVAREVETLAASRRLSVNALVVSLLDEMLVKNGRPSVQELAPEFVEYLRRRGGQKRPAKKARADLDGGF